MAAKKKANSGAPELVPALEENPVLQAVGDESGQQAETALSGEAAEAAKGQEASPEETAGEKQPWEAVYKEPAGTPSEQDIFAEAQDFVPAPQPEAERTAPEAGEPETEPPEVEASEPEQKRKIFKITCRNNVSATIGGVMFIGGVGYTRNAYAASWFANKDGYKVDSE